MFFMLLILQILFDNRKKVPDHFKNLPMSRDHRKYSRKEKAHIS